MGGAPQALVVLGQFRRTEKGMRRYTGCTDCTHRASDSLILNICFQRILDSSVFPWGSQRKPAGSYQLLSKLTMLWTHTVVLPRAEVPLSPVVWNWTEFWVTLDLIRSLWSTLWPFLILIVWSCCLLLPFFLLCFPFSSRAQFWQRGNSHLGFTSDWQISSL